MSMTVDSFKWLQYSPFTTIMDMCTNHTHFYYHENVCTYLGEYVIYAILMLKIILVIMVYKLTDLGACAPVK